MCILTEELIKKFKKKKKNPEGLFMTNVSFS